MALLLISTITMTYLLPLLLATIGLLSWTAVFSRLIREVLWCLHFFGIVFSDFSFVEVWPPHKLAIIDGP